LFICCLFVSADGCDLSLDNWNQWRPKCCPRNACVSRGKKIGPRPPERFQYYIL